MHYVVIRTLKLVLGSLYVFCGLSCGSGHTFLKMNFLKVILTKNKDLETKRNVNNRVSFSLSV